MVTLLFLCAPRSPRTPGPCFEFPSPWPPPTKHGPSRHAEPHALWGTREGAGCTAVCIYPHPRDPNEAWVVPVFALLPRTGPPTNARFLSQWSGRGVRLMTGGTRFTSRTPQGATDWEHFELEGRDFIAVSNEGDLGNNLHQQSFVYLMDTDCALWLPRPPPGPPGPRRLLAAAAVVMGLVGQCVRRRRQRPDDEKLL